MPLTKCPDCEANVSDLARACPKCGRPIPPTVATAAQKFDADTGQVLAGMPTEDAGVIVTDVRMRFGSMVVFMIKWALASIPAMIILVLIVASIQAFLWGLLMHR